jgi:hypothetical protein
MRVTGRIEPVDEALVALGRVIADQADAIEHDEEHSPFVRNSLYRTMLSTVTALRDTAHTDADLPSLDDLFAGLVDDTNRPAH